MITDYLAWSKENFSYCKLGDQRLTKRLIKMGAYLASRVGNKLSACFEGNNTETTGAYRLIRNESVLAEAILDGICQTTAAQAKESACLLAIEDTTSLSYQHSVRDELGYIGNSTSDWAKGFLVHTAILVDADSEHTLGIIDQHYWSRDNDAYGKRERRKQRSYEEKESVKWETVSKKIAVRLGNQMDQTISICDREADIFAYLHYKKNENQRFVIRAAQDRILYDRDGDRISDAWVDNKVLGHYEVYVTQKGGRKARTARVELRASHVEIKIPKSQENLYSSHIDVNVVYATEINPPSGQKPLTWVLLTSEPIGSYEQALQVIRYYEKRWLIEEFHKCWKSGAGVEKVRMQTADNLKRMIVILAPIAIRLLQLRESLGRNRDQTSCCSEVLTPDEFIVLWRSIEKKKRIPTKKPTLEWAYRSIARLGGWNDSKRTGKACWSTLWEGWFLLEERLKGYQLAQELA